MHHIQVHGGPLRHVHGHSQQGRAPLRAPKDSEFRTKEVHVTGQDLNLKLRYSGRGSRQPSHVTLESCNNPVMAARSRSRSPLPPTKSSSHPLPAPAPAPALLIPEVNIFLDPSLIPSLPPSGELVGHNALMGRPRIISNTPSPEPRAPAVPLKDVHHPRPDQSPGALGLPRPGAIRRSSSFEHGKRRGSEGAVAVSEGDIRVGEIVGSSQSLGNSGPARPSVIRRTSSFEHHISSLPLRGDLGGIDGRKQGLTGPKGARATTRGRVGGHSRTASDSTNDAAHTIHNGLARTSSRQQSISKGKHTRSSSSIPSFLANCNNGCIRLGGESDLATTSKLLLKLAALTPPCRMSDIPLPAHSTGILHPTSLLTPLAIILEALVAERTILRSPTPRSPPSKSTPIAPLPVLRDGSSLRLKGGSGEIDWNIMRPYVLAVGTVIDQLMPFLQKSKEKKEVEGLTKGLRVYVSKQKKVFGEVAAMYVEGYGFLRGWWDETGMKGCAGEVGRWGDMVDA